MFQICIHIKFGSLIKLDNTIKVIHRPHVKVNRDSFVFSFNQNKDCVSPGLFWLCLCHHLAWAVWRARPLYCFITHLSCAYYEINHKETKSFNGRKGSWIKPACQIDRSYGWRRGVVFLGHGSHCLSLTWIQNPPVISDCTRHQVSSPQSLLSLGHISPGPVYSFTM